MEEGQPRGRRRRRHLLRHLHAGRVQTRAGRRPLEEPPAHRPGMRLPQATALAGATAAVAAVLTVCTVSADTAAAPVAPYPQAAPDPVDGNVVPQLVDDDELVHVQLAPDGAVRGMVDDVRIKLMGQGDFAMRLPGPVVSVADLGGESVPGLQNGHVSFLGRVDGIKHVAAQATLNPSLYADRIPLGVAITYLHDGSPVGAAALARTRGDV